MTLKEEILNIYRHSKGLFQSAERLARANGVLKCPTCDAIHDIDKPHAVRKTESGVPVEHKKLK